MKKLFAPVLLSLLMTSLSGCNNFNIEHNLIFTELCIGKASINRAVEIYNLSDESIDLSNYYINIYRNGGGSQKPTENIKLEGVLQGKSTFVLAFPEACDEILSRADMVSEDFLTDGSFPMTIKYKNKYIVDKLGVIGYSHDIGEHTDLVRKKEALYYIEDFNAYNFIRYPVDTYSNLGNVDCVSNDILNNGPRLTEEDFAKPFATEATHGEGGLVEVDLVGTVDGDTSKFNFGYEYADFGISGTMSLRYYGVNTPEIAHFGNPADPYGNEARDYTNSLLREAKKFYIQSITNYSLHETYGRALGYLWVSFVDNPKPEDFENMSYLIIKEGYSNPSYLDRLDLCNYMTYEGISYVEYLYDANNLAKNLNKNIHSIQY